MTRLLYVLALLALGAGMMDAPAASAREVTLTPSTSLILENPGDSRDIRLLCQFNRPKELEQCEIIRAFLLLRTGGGDGLAVTALPIGTAWNAQDTWSSVGSARADEVPKGSPTEATEGELGELCVPLTAQLQTWNAGGEQTFGLCLRGVPMRDSPAKRVLGPALGTPVLVIIYVPQPR